MSRDAAKEIMQKMLDFYVLACKEESMNKEIAFKHFYELGLDLRNLLPDKRVLTLRLRVHFG